MVRYALLILMAIGILTIAVSQNPISTLSLNHSLSSEDEMRVHELYAIETHLIDVDVVKDLLSHASLWEDLSVGSYYLLESRFENLIEYSESLSKDPRLGDTANLLKAMYYFDQKAYPISLNYFELIKDTDDPEVRMKYGYALFANKQFAKASEQLSHIPGGTPFSVPASYYLGMSAYYQGNYDESIQYLTKVDQIVPYARYTPAYITQIYFAQKDYDAVISYGRDYVLDNNPLIHHLMGQSYYQMNNHEQALHHLTMYEEQTTKLTAEEFFQLGKLNEAVGKKDKALEYYGEIANMNSDISNNAKYLMAGIYRSQDKQEEAVTLLEEVGASNLNVRDNANLQAAQLNANLGNNKQALQLSDRIPESSNYFAKAQELASQVLENDGDLEGSLRYLEQKPRLSSALESTYNRLLVKKVTLLGTNGEYTQVTPTIERAKLSSLNDQQSAILNFWKGKSYFAEGNVSGSLQPLSTATASLPQEYRSDAHYMIAYAEASNGNDAAANRAINTAIASSTGMDREYRKNLNMLAANTSLGTENRSEAKSQYEAAAKLGSDVAIFQLAKIAKVEDDTYTRIYLLESLVEQHPESVYAQESYFELGESHIQLGKFSKAIDFFDQAIESKAVPTDITYESFLRLGLCHYNLGKLNEATTAYEHVASNSPSGSQQLVAVNALKEVYLNDQGDPDKYFEFVESSTDLEIDQIEKDSIAYSVGNSRFEAGDYAGSINSLQKYIDKYPEGLFVSEAIYQAAEAHLYQQNYREALAYYKQYLARDARGNSYQEAKRKAALIALNNTNEFALSYQYYNELIPVTTDPSLKKEAIDGALYSAIKLKNGEAGRLAEYVINDPSRSESEKAKAYYHKGKYMMTTGEDDGAIQALTQVTRMNKSNIAAEANYLVASLFYKKGNLESAERQAKESTKRSREYPLWIAKSLLLLGDIYIDKEDLLNAQAATEAVLENYQENSEIKGEAEEKLQLIKTILDSKSRVLPSESDTIQFIDVEPIENPNNN